MEREGLAGWEIHGFRTMEDLDIPTIMEEARTRWLRTNEIHAILSNHHYFSINVKPWNLPKSGTVLLFDRKVLRNFRNDGHNWRKKNDGKTVKEAHEHLKVGAKERIHVYYAHGQDNPTFVRRCYWLLDKALEHIVLVHYRETQELQSSPVTPMNSNSSPGISDLSAPSLPSEETDLVPARASYDDPGESIPAGHIERRMHEINTLDWEELVDLNSSAESSKSDTVGLQLLNQQILSSSKSSGFALQANGLAAEASSYWTPTNSISSNNSISYNMYEVVCGAKLRDPLHSYVDKIDSTVGTGDSSDILVKDGLQSQDSFGRWMDSIVIDSMGSLDNPLLESEIPSNHGSLVTPMIDHQQSTVPIYPFCITDMSSSWVFSSERTKILVTGYFHEEHALLAKSNLFCICGSACFPAEIVQVGVYRFFVSQQAPGLVKFYLSIDGHTPITPVLDFEYRTPILEDAVVSLEDTSKWEEFRIQMRLANLLFSKSKTLSFLANKVSPKALKEANNYAARTSHIVSVWDYLINAVQDNKVSFSEARDSLFEHALKSRLQEWLLERIINGRKVTNHDERGQGVIHLCAILGYTWAVLLYSFSGLSLDYRDKFGWTALHWAASCGREKMVAVLLSAGARPNLVTDPSSENDGGCTAADLASKNGFEGLAAYLAEKALVEHFREMTIAGNVSGSLQINSTDPVKSEDLSEEELNLKETLAAYRTAADAAARIQTAFREQSFKLREKAIKISNVEKEAKSIIAAMKIQHAYRKYERRKQMDAAVHIQYMFRSWKIRKDFLNMRRKAIKIQAVFRGYKQRKQYHKIIWSVGVIEKAILRWRLKRKGFREFEVDPSQLVQNLNHEEIEEDFFRASRKLAEERVEGSVIKVQAMFRSKKAQVDYRRMKLAHDEAKLAYEELLDPDIHIDKRGAEIE